MSGGLTVCTIDHAGAFLGGAWGLEIGVRVGPSLGFLGLRCCDALGFACLSQQR
jgi:hypothetical protein